MIVNLDFGLHGSRVSAAADSFHGRRSIGPCTHWSFARYQSPSAEVDVGEVRITVRSGVTNGWADFLTEVTPGFRSG